MVWTLHGAVGSHKDWKDFRLDSEITQSVNLWRFLQCCPKSIEETGIALNNEITSVNPTLLGYSMGGRIALHALLAENSPWEKAIIVSADTGISNEESRARRRQRDTEWASQALSGDWNTFIKNWNAQSILPKLHDESFFERAQLKPWRQQIARSFIDWSTGAQQDLLPKLHNIKIPILWITGDTDKKFSKIAKRAILEIPNGTHISVKNSGHRVPWEQPKDFLSIVQDFLK